MSRGEELLPVGARRGQPGVAALTCLPRVALTGRGAGAAEAEAAPYRQASFVRVCRCHAPPAATEPGEERWGAHPADSSSGSPLLPCPSFSGPFALLDLSSGKGRFAVQLHNVELDPESITSRHSEC